jgi:bacillithiol biosynthesis cysteine-adding enzyme BshC
MAARPPLVLDYGAFQQPPSALFRDYLMGCPPAAPFYDGGRWDLDALLGSAETTLSLSRPRTEVAAALVHQQESREASVAAARARELASPDAVAVVTGQQPGLFGGPLYVLHKALAAVKVAALLQERRGRPVVPVFWVAADDHDFAEVRSVSVLDEGGQIRTLRYAPAREPIAQPASHIVLDETITDLVAELSRCLAPGLHREPLVALVAQAYRPGATLSGAFARLLSSIVPEIVVLDPTDPVLKRLAAPILAREIRESSPTSRLALEAGRRLLAAGYHQQVPVREGFLNAFVVVDSERRALGIENGTVEVRGLGRKMTVDEAMRMVESNPEAWSPGVLLRPLVQDRILPTDAYVGGPAEVAYHAQIDGSYAHFGIPRPVIFPRPSLTIVEPAQARALETEGLTLPELQADPEGLLARWARESNPEIEAAFGRTRTLLEESMGAVEDLVGTLDPTLRAATDAAKGRAIHQIEGLHEKVTRALKKRDQSRAERLRRTRDALLPGGSFQERGLGVINLVARHGPPGVAEIRERMDPWAAGHQVIYL